MRATASTSKKNILHDVKVEQWEEAEERFKILRETITSHLSFSNLQSYQIGVWAKYRESAKSLNGDPILVIADASGTPYPDFPYPATILKAYEEGGLLHFKCVYHPIEEEAWTGERIETVALFQMMPLTIPAEASNEFLMEMRLQLLLGTINNARNATRRRLAERKNDYETSLRSLRRDITKYERYIKDVDQQLASSEDNNLSVMELKKTIDELGHNKKVDWAFLDQDGELIVQTHMLYATHPTAKTEDKNQPIGRFAFRIRPATGNIQAMNLDYISADRGRYHPNLDGTSICMGDNQTHIQDMCRGAQFYDLVDFLILFFSLFPHDEGRPYQSHESWLQAKTAHATTNQWVRGRTKVYQIKTDKKLVERATKKKGIVKKIRKALKKKTEEATPEQASSDTSTENTLRPGESLENQLQQIAEREQQEQDIDHFYSEADDMERYDEDGNLDPEGEYDADGEYIDF